jgi:serine/threonine-protein kinase
MAPEQMKSSHAVDHRADIYSLGVVLYEMLTGELPVGRFEPPSKRAQVDVRLDEVVLRALESEPERRYQHASQVKSDVESIASTDQAALRPTVDFDTASGRRNDDSGATSLEQRELAGRLLLLRRQLMGRVESSLRPLFWGQIVQMLFGIGLVALGVYCWAPNKHIPHRLASGIVLHVYGLLMILAAGVVCARIKRLDYSKSTLDIREQLDGIRNTYLRFGTFLGLAWWLMWIPVAVAVGFDGIVYPQALGISIGVGLLGLALSVFVCVRFVKSDHPSSAKCREILAGDSLRAAYRALDEIVDADVE